MTAKFPQWRDSFILLFDFLVAQRAEHRGHRLSLEFPSLDGEVVIHCTDCNQSVLSGSVSLVDQAYREFLRHR
jgi:hypothetical protein